MSAERWDDGSPLPPEPHGYDITALYDPEVAEAVPAADPEDMRAETEAAERDVMARGMAQEAPTLTLYDGSPIPEPDPVPGVSADGSWQAEIAQGLAPALAATHAYLTRYVAFPSPHESVAVTLWAAHAWAIAVCESSPYLAVTSVHERSGKTRLRECLERLVPRPWGVITPSEAVLYRKIEQDHPTLLLDEADAIFGSRRQAEAHEGVRAIINAGNRRGTTVARMVGEGKKMRVHDFAVFGPKVILGIGDLPRTIADRAVPIRLERRARSEHVERFRLLRADAEGFPIRDALDTAVTDAMDALADHHPAMPHELGDRAVESWEPLLVIADVAGGDWPTRARSAAIALSGERMDDLDDAPAALLLLSDMRDIFTRRDTDRLMTAQLLEDLAADDERPWADWRDGKPLNSHGMGRLLRGYHVKPALLRFGGRSNPARGYLRADLEPVWSRYLPPMEADPDDLQEDATRLQTVTPLHRTPL